MTVHSRKYRAMVSSDWNECLAPCGPFDFISYHWPALEKDMARIFRNYTANRISLAHALEDIHRLLPAPVTRELMDSYLDSAFHTYKNVPAFMEWCHGKRVLFMINTTGMIGYFQRAAARKLIPEIGVLSAHPMIRYAREPTDPSLMYDLLSISDKPENTELAARRFGIPREKIIVIGDSGGDGPHFEWGAAQGAFLIGAMTKSSLAQYCRTRQITIDLNFGPETGAPEKRDFQKELQTDFMGLVPVIEEAAGL